MQEMTFQAFLREARAIEQSLQTPNSVLAGPDALADTLISWIGPHGWKKHIRRGKDVLVQGQTKARESRNAQMVQQLIETRAAALANVYCYDRIKLKQVPSEKLITRIRAPLRRRSAEAQLRGLIEVLQSIQDIEIYEDKNHIPLPGKSKSLYVFLSYSRLDHAVVHEISRFFGQYGIDHFIDEKSIHPGDQISLKVSQALERCTHFLLFWSPNAAKSEFVASEWSVGYTQEILQNNKLIVILLDGAPSPPALLSAKRFIRINNGMFARSLSELMKAFTQG